jgi:hypothetical protein
MGSGINQPTLLWVQEIITVIKELQNDFSLNKGMILTEGDLECQLFKRLTDNSLFKGYQKSKHIGWRTGYVHSQVTWFKADSNSGFCVDLTVCDPANLNIDNLEMIEKFPGKVSFTMEWPWLSN